MSAHTQGPWRITRRNRSPCRVEGPTGSGAALATVYLTDPDTRRRTPEYEANARLIEQAPALYDALRGLVATARTFRNVPRAEQAWTSIDDAALDAAFQVLAAIDAGDGAAREVQGGANPPEVCQGGSAT